VRFVAAGCQNYQDGFYTAYRRISEEELDFVWHYGDYIYEARGKAASTDGQGVKVRTPRQHVGDETFSLDDYRQRYAQYRLDPDLQAAHAAHSWWTTWDDHEIVNNWAGDHDGQDHAPPALFNLRRQAAAQAYYEHLPLRARSVPHGTAIQIFRQARYGSLLSAFFLDTRQFRQPQPCGDGMLSGCVAADRPDGRIMSAREEAWLLQGLSTAGPGWKFIANQVMMMPLDRQLEPGGPDKENMDSWSGYAAARRRLLDHLHGKRIGDVVVVTGDEHQNFAGELRHRGSGPSVAVEFVATSISSGGDGSDQRPGTQTILSRNPHVTFMNDQRGYVLCEVTAMSWRTDYKVLDRVSEPGGRLTTRAGFAVERGRASLVRTA
jgi:alkaline phosphatase D